MFNFPGSGAGAELSELAPKSMLNDAVKIQDSPAGINVIVEQSRVTKFQVTASASGLEVYFAPQIINYNYESVPGGARVRIQATGPLNYSTTRLKNPDRLVLDLPDALLMDTKPAIDVNDETVTWYGRPICCGSGCDSFGGRAQILSKPPIVTGRKTRELVLSHLVLSKVGI